MKNKGFTLIELLGVIIVLGVIAMITVPAVNDSLKEHKDNLCKVQYENILVAAKAYGADHLVELNDGDIITLKNLQDNGYIEEDIKNPKKTGEIIDSSLEIVVVKSGNKISYKFKEAIGCLGNEEYNENIVCKRATTLHTEECTQTDSTYYCSSAGYVEGNKGTTITYGSLGTKGTLISGDAFDCDVNGDGTYDATTERFYYVSDLYDTNSNTYNSNYAVLIYYNNTKEGEPDNTTSGLVAYDTSNENWNGPVTAVTNLPTKGQWSNVSLASPTRAITNQNGGTTTSGGTLPTAFDYSNYATRLLTFQEVTIACGSDSSPTSTGYLDKCNYLMENTQYSSYSKGTSGYWLETPNATNIILAWDVQGHSRHINNHSTSDANSRGSRPAIEVRKSDISY